MKEKTFRYPVKEVYTVRGRTPKDADKELEKFFEETNAAAYRMVISIQRGSLTQEETDEQAGEQLAGW